jgi:GNAT superfamily N-acetyltransferase
MITFARESFREIQTEYGKFVYEYWDNSPENSGHIPLDFNWDAYTRLDINSVLHLTVGRDDGKMVAAALYLLTNNIKHRGLMTAHCDTFAVSRDYRGQGLGRQLFAAVEPQLIALGIKEIHNSYREVYHTKPIFETLGFELMERIYVKKCKEGNV